MKSCGEPTGPNESVADEWSDRSVFQKAIETAIGENLGSESLTIDKMEWLWQGTIKDRMPEELQFISTFILVMENKITEYKRDVESVHGTDTDTDTCTSMFEYSGD